jgi:hypothetical protein
MSDFMLCNWANLSRSEGYHSDRVAIECHEFHFIAGMTTMHQDDGSDISSNKSNFGEVLFQYHSIVFSDHRSSLIFNG